MNLSEIQQELKAPKNQKNTFGNYNYRSCEDILTAVKPMLGSSELTMSDRIECVGGKNYVIAEIQFTEMSEDPAKQYHKRHVVTACAREADIQKGMTASQITGCASSYARKYALNGLFLIDDTKDDDATNKHDKEAPAPRKSSDGSKKKSLSDLGV